MGDFDLAGYLHRITPWRTTSPRLIPIRSSCARSPVQRHTASARHVLRRRSYTLRCGASESTRELADRELGPVLREELALDLPADLLQRLRSRLVAMEQA